MMSNVLLFSSKSYLQRRFKQAAYQYRQMRFTTLPIVLTPCASAIPTPEVAATLSGKDNLLFPGYNESPNALLTSPSYPAPAEC